MPVARRLAAAGLASLGALALAPAARAQLPIGKKLDEQSLVGAVEMFRIAMQKADKAAFEKLCSDAMSYGHSAGKIENKAEFIAGSTNGKTTWKSIAFNDATHKVAGTEGISRFTLIGQTESEGKTTDIKIGVLMVWRDEKGAWKLLARQAFRL